MTGDARTAALAAVLALDAVDILDRAWERVPMPEDPRDGALARELALGAVRWLRLYDALVAPFLRLKPPPVLAWGLRIGCHQLLALDRVPPSAAVDRTVEAIGDCGGDRVRGAANAILRRIAERRLEERIGEGPLGRWPVPDHPREAGVRLSMPDLLLRDLASVRTAWPECEPADLDRLPPLCLRARPEVTITPHAAMLRQEDRWSWWSDPTEAIRRWVEPGHAVVQDRTQGMVMDTIDQLGVLRPGALVADWCAAPGGKATSLAERQATVIACDQPNRLKQVDARFPRLAHDGRRGALSAAFDLVLVDVPCSNTGTLARHPEARWRYNRQQCDQLVALQKGLLRSAARAVRPDGVLVYATCSVITGENQGVAHALDGWRLLAEHRSWPDGWHGGGYHAVLVRS